ncbi:hypothetical protein AOQ84DRAFT_365544 [Glonium stellatum]|uniref:Uncharacterized protein n=1 Tax=Glonium stellatum TaxID=574774 RepID=A0A8E2EY18_9PEZI|nr:hypothetical protein AOQ84DRAFT_365544 [Glonium stellatum]
MTAEAVDGGGPVSGGSGGSGGGGGGLVSVILSSPNPKPCACEGEGEGECECECDQANRKELNTHTINVVSIHPSQPRVTQSKLCFFRSPMHAAYLESMPTRCGDPSFLGAIAPPPAAPAPASAASPAAAICSTFHLPQFLPSARYTVPHTQQSRRCVQ